MLEILLGELILQRFDCLGDEPYRTPPEFLQKFQVTEDFQC